QGQVAPAAALYREALESCRKSRAVGHPDIALCLNNLANVLQDEAAEPLYREAISIDEAAFQKDHWHVANARSSLGRVLMGLKRFAEAELELLEAERILATGKGVPAGRHDKCLQALIELYGAWDVAEAGKGYAAKANQWKEKQATKPGSNP